MSPSVTISDALIYFILLITIVIIITYNHKPYLKKYQSKYSSEMKLSDTNDFDGLNSIVKYFSRTHMIDSVSRFVHVNGKINSTTSYFPSSVRKIKQFLII